METQHTEKKHGLEIRGLHVSVQGKEILKGISLKVRTGETHIVMGPNGSGKTTLSYVLMGHPGYEVTSGEVLLDGENVLEMPVEKRAQKGIFLAFQYPMAVAGVTVSNFLRTAYNTIQSSHGKRQMLPFEFDKLLREKMELLKMDYSFAGRYLNDGFSGGEKKRCEILQMAVLEPKMAVLDEIDSGLDIDAVRTVSEGINKLKDTKGIGILLITHYQRILKYVKPDHVHVMMNGKIVRSGGHALAEELEEKGYDWLLPKEELGGLRVI